MVALMIEALASICHRSGVQIMPAPSSVVNTKKINTLQYQNSISVYVHYLLVCLCIYITLFNIIVREKLLTLPELVCVCLWICELTQIITFDNCLGANTLGYYLLCLCMYIRAINTN